MFRLRTLNSLMNEVYTRIISGKPYDKELNPYTEKQVKDLLMFFEQNEEYEKCEVVKLYLQSKSHGNDYLK